MYRRKVERVLEVAAMRFLLWSGLVMNIVGTILISFSFGKNLEDAYQTDRKGRRVYLASFLRPTWFRWGIIVLLLGFCVQLLHVLISPN